MSIIRTTPNRYKVDISEEEEFEIINLEDHITTPKHVNDIDFIPPNAKPLS